MSELPLHVFNTIVTTSAAMDADKVGTPLNLNQVEHIAIHAVWTGSPTGNIVVKGSNDGITYTTISTTAAGGAPGSLLTNVPNVAYAWLRVDYTYTSSTGVLTVTVNGKR